MNLKDIEFLYPHKGLIVVLLIVIFFFFIFLLRRLQKKRLFFSFFRFLIFLLFIFLLFQPQYNLREKLVTKPILAVLLDSSESMNLNDPYPRWERVKKFFLREPFKELKKNYQLQFYTFSDKLYPWEDKFPSPKGKVTNITQALKEISKTENLIGIILITDGQHNQGEDPFPTPDLPIYCLGVGNPQPKDLAIEEIRHSDFAFKNIPLDIEVNLSGYGFEGKNIPVSLWEKNVSNQIIHTKNVKIDSQGKGKVELTFTPQELGEKVYLVSVPTYKDEVTPANNSKEFLLNVVREKIRILYLCGQANYEYSYLRNVLKNDPSIELVSFVILRNPENIAFVSDEQLSLIPFPAHEIFFKELFNYDLVILENFTYMRFGIHLGYLDNLHRFVNEKGGGLIMIGGDNAFARGGYKGTAIEDLLPAEILSAHEEKIISGLFRLQIENYNHPIINLGNTNAETIRIWQEMPELDSCNYLGRVKTGAAVLGIHSREKIPILVVWEKGRGRVLVMASNTTWRWALGLAGESKNNQVYSQFWQKAMRWLTRAEEMKRVRIILEKKHFREDEKIPVRIHVYDENYRPLKEAKIKVYLTFEGSKKRDLSSELSPFSKGGYWLELNPKNIGKYSLEAEAWHPQRGGGYLGEDKISFQVLTTGEKDKLTLNENLLRSLATVSGGKYFYLEDFNPEEIKLPEKEELARIKKKINLWNQPYFYFLVCLFLTLEWYLRRKSGLL